MQVVKPQAREPDPLDEQSVSLPRPKLVNSSAEEKTILLVFHSPSSSWKPSNKPWSAFTMKR